MNVIHSKNIYVHLVYLSIIVFQYIFYNYEVLLMPKLIKKHEIKKKNSSSLKKFLHNNSILKTKQMINRKDRGILQHIGKKGV